MKVYYAVKNIDEKYKLWSIYGWHDDQTLMKYWKSQDEAKHEVETINGYSGVLYSWADMSRMHHWKLGKNYMRDI